MPLKHIFERSKINSVMSMSTVGLGFAISILHLPLHEGVMHVVKITKAFRKPR